jgi:hypothetical protein
LLLVVERIRLLVFLWRLVFGLLGFRDGILEGYGGILRGDLMGVGEIKG